MVERFGVYLVNLDPTIGKEIQKIRPCVVVSPDSINAHWGTILIAPMTSTIRNIPTRIKIVFQGKNGDIALDQIRSIDKTRLIKKIGEITSKKLQYQICDTLSEMFKY